MIHNQVRLEYARRLTNFLSASGNATLTEPEGGWNFTALQDIFSLKAAKSNDARAGASPTPSLSATPPLSTDKSSSSHTGAIAGGVVGGILGLAVLALLIYIASRRRRRQSQSTKSGKSLTKPTFMHNLFNNSDDGTTYYEKDAQQRAELSPANRFEIGDGNAFVAPRELDATNVQRHGL